MEFGEPTFKCAFCKISALMCETVSFGETEIPIRSKVSFCYRCLEPGTFCKAPI